MNQHAQVREHAGLLRGVTITQPPLAPSRSAAGCSRPGLVTTDHAVALQANVVSAALGLAFLDAGWPAPTAPGGDVVFRCHADELRPYRELAMLATGELAPADCASRCMLLGIEGPRLDARPAA